MPRLPKRKAPSSRWRNEAFRNGARDEPNGGEYGCLISILYLTIDSFLFNLNISILRKKYRKLSIIVVQSYNYQTGRLTVLISAFIVI